MAKSLRSKWRRKCRAVKRERYGQKELERLKKTLGVEEGSNATDVKMENISDVATVVDAKNIQEKQIKLPITPDEDCMEVDGKKRVFNAKTLKDQHGTYPVWVHPRKIRKDKKIAKAKLKKKGKSKKKH